MNWLPIIGGVVSLAAIGLFIFAFRAPKGPVRMDLEESADVADLHWRDRHKAALRKHMIANLEADLARAVKNKKRQRDIKAKLKNLGVRPGANPSSRPSARPDTPSLLRVKA